MQQTTPLTPGIFPQPGAARQRRLSGFHRKRSPHPLRPGPQAHPRRPRFTRHRAGAAQYRLAALLIWAAVIGLLLASCTPESAPNGAQGLHLQQILAQQTQSALEGAYTATAERELGDIATQVAVEHATALALAVRMTEQALHLQATQAVATMAADQANSTATAQAQASGTARADLQATSTALAQGTATALAYASGTSTARAVQTQAARQEQAEARQTAWQTFWRISAAAVLLASLAVLGVLIFKLLPWVQVKYLGTREWHGKPIAMIPDGRGGLVVGDITRSLGPGLVLDAQGGEVAAAGIFENPELQAQVVARAQAAELLLAAISGSGQLNKPQREALLRQAVHAGAEAAAAPYRILAPQEAPPPGLARPGTVEILDAEWREIDA